MNDHFDAFSDWLNSAMQTHGLSQAALARKLGVADTQISRWRRGQVTPTVRYLHQLAETFGVDRMMLDQLAGYPIVQAVGDTDRTPTNATIETELHAYLARYRRVLEEDIPHAMWAAYVESCEAFATALRDSFHHAVSQMQVREDATSGQNLEPTRGSPQRTIGFHPRNHDGTAVGE